MARRTKEEALATRSKLLDAAECLFQSQGVSRTTLQDIALRAGATRGAVYWHFKDKADLFNAMMERGTLPLEKFFRLDPATQQAPEATHNAFKADALEHIRSALLNILRQIANDPQTRRVLEVATHKVEYTEEHQSIRLRHLTVRNGFLSQVAQGLSAAARQEHLKHPLQGDMAAQGLHALVDGLLQNWMLDPQAFDLVQAGQYSMDVYLTGLGFDCSQPCRAALAQK